MRFWRSGAESALIFALAVALAACDRDGARGNMAVAALDLERGADAVVLHTRLDLRLSPPVYEALHNGVPLAVLLEARVQRERGWIWPRTLSSNQRRFELTYHSLSDQYLVLRDGEDTPRAFPSREAMLSTLESPEPWSLPLPAAGGRDLEVGVRVRLELHTLPAPLRLVAAFSPAWRLGSDWRRETLTP